MIGSVPFRKKSPFFYQRLLLCHRCGWVALKRSRWHSRPFYLNAIKKKAVALYWCIVKFIGEVH